MKVIGKPRTFHASAASFTGSSNTGTETLSLVRKRETVAFDSPKFTVTSSKERPLSFSRRRSSAGISSRQGSHHVAQKFTSTTRPFITARSKDLSWRSRSFRAGVAPPFHGLISASAAAGPQASIQKASAPAVSRGARFPRIGSGEFARGHRVLEVVRIERVEAPLCGLALRIHEEPDLALRRLGQHD